MSLYLLTIAACGYAIAIAVFGGQRRRFVEVAGLSLAMGVGVVPLILIWLSMLGMRPTRVPIFILLAIALIGITFFSRHVPKMAASLLPRLERSDALALPALLLMGLVLAALIGSAVTVPQYNMDAMAIWGLKAKVLYHEALSPRPAYFTDLTLSYSHLDYPLLVPMLWAGAYGAVGSVNEFAGNLAMLVPVFALLTLLYASLRELAGLPRSRAMLLTALVVGVPSMARWAGQGDADIPLALFLLGAGVMLLNWLRDWRWQQAAAAGLFAGMAGLSKLEGMVVVLSTMLIATIALLALRNRSAIVGWIACIVSILIALLPWLVWSHDLPHTHENYGSRMSWTILRNGLERLPQLGVLIRHELAIWSWITVGGIFLAAALLGWRAWRIPSVLALWTMLLIQVGGYLWAYLVAPWDLAELVPMTANRLLLQIVPLTMLIAGFHWRSAAGPSIAYTPQPNEVEGAPIRER